MKIDFCLLSVTYSFWSYFPSVASAISILCVDSVSDRDGLCSKLVIWDLIFKLITNVSELCKVSKILSSFNIVCMSAFILRYTCLHGSLQPWYNPTFYQLSQNSLKLLSNVVKMFKSCICCITLLMKIKKSLKLNCDKFMNVWYNLAFFKVMITCV